MTSRYIAGRYPSPGSSDIADQIRERRGIGSLTPLDGTLLHVPPFADGWDTLLRAVCSEGKIPGDVRELLILRVAAHNRAAYEWIHHEHVGRDAGLTIPQLTTIRDILKIAPSPLSPGPLTSLQAAALAFADASTKDIIVSDSIFVSLSNEFQNFLPDGPDVEQKVQDLLVETAAIVSTYNMVSRFLVSLDVAGQSDEQVPWPFDREEHTVPIPHTSLTLHAITLTVSPTAPWLVFCNALLTNTSLWSLVVPAITSKGYNVLLHDQRGHGHSSIPDPPYCTMTDLADDIATLLDQFRIQRAHAVIGVSQSGAAVLQFSLRHPNRTERIIACDTQAKAPIADIVSSEEIERAKKYGVGALASEIASQWFPPESLFHPSSGSTKSKAVLEMISNTPILGFEAGAQSLKNYDLFADGLFQSKVKTLLVVGEKDSVLLGGMKKLEKGWANEGGDVRFAEISGAGHLPMLDGANGWLEAVVGFLEN